MFVLSENEDMPPINIQCHDQLANYQIVEEDLGGKPWYYDIKKYFKSQEYPLSVSKNDKRTLSFFLSGEVLYKKNYDMILLRCVDVSGAQKIIKKVHQSSFGTHTNGHAMRRKILRVGYYWSTIETNCFHYVRKCHKC